ncbi:MAG TPA: hypothetical protein VGC01_06635 [Mucilaginibacter sp.]
MKLTKAQYLLIITILLGIYYLICGIYLNKLGYYSPEGLFYVEKARVVFEGMGQKLKVVGLTSPLLPFYSTFIFTSISAELAPVFASAIGTAMLFYIIAATMTKRIADSFYLVVLLAIFLFHPGMLYTACSGKGIYMALIFFFMFFLNIFKYYTSNTTFHISIASMCLIVLVFCDYKFIWLTLFFIPLVFSIAVHSLNLGEKEHIFRISLSFNNPSLRRKLINKTFAIYVILFILPVASIICYKLLNLTNANDVDYFIESPYATWTVLAERLNYESFIMSTNFKSPDISLLISAKVLLFCPLMLLSIYLFRQNNYQILTLLTPFALIEFLHIKYEKAAIVYEYYLMFIILSFLCIIIRGPALKNQLTFKILLGAGIAIQLFSGYYYMKNSPVAEERNFLTVLTQRTVDGQQDENKDMAGYLNGLPDDAKILLDDAVCYQIVAFTNNVKNLTMPYQENFISAIETPWDYDNYILIASDKNPVRAYSVLNTRYGPIMNMANNTKLQKVYETEHWSLYHIL